MKTTKEDTEDSIGSTVLLADRRSFIKGLAALFVGKSIPVVVAPRQPFVTKEMSGVPSWIGPCGGFIGGCAIQSIGEWDGVGYPVHCYPNTYGLDHPLNTYYDFDLSCFNHDVPDGFWKSEENCRKYPNVHTFVRTQRYGETVAEAIEKLGFASDFSKFKFQS